MIALRDTAQAAHDQANRKGFANRSGYALKAVKGWSFSVPEGESEPWHTPITATTEIGQLEARIVDAAYVVISYLCGPRDSEMSELRAGCLERGEHITADGLEQITYIVGDIRKTDQVRHRWVAAPEAVRAVEVMERLSAPLRERSGRDTLFLTARSRGLIGPRDTIAPISNTRMTRRLNALRDFLNLPDYHGEPWHLTTHQGRKTFSRFVARKDKTALYALQSQLGHVTRAMTDRGYVGSDTELLEDIIQENWTETQELLEHLFMQDSLGGKAGKRIEEQNPFQGRSKNPDEVHAFVQSILEDTEINIAPCEWGLCLYRSETARCGGDETGPNRIHANPSLCAGCQNLAVGPQHRPHWAKRKADDVEIRDHPHTDVYTRRFCEERIRESEAMLAQIDGEE